MSYTIINCGLSELSQEIKSKLTVEKELFFQKNSLLSEAVNLLAQKNFHLHSTRELTFYYKAFEFTKLCKAYKHNFLFFGN
ncbi:MAG: hypothetical protein BGO10_06575 [Chlamydia sp. 32-24]|mgnify:CR=1 FL=1|nr:MAG: hypothetical protein BGO10_06575 [Chlamydia sp. 32-24]